MKSSSFLLLGVLVLFILALMTASQTLYEAHLEDNETFNIYNFTETKLVWNYSYYEESIKDNISDMTHLDYSQISSMRFRNIINKCLDAFGYSFMEISKWAIEYGYTHPEYNFRHYMNIVNYCLYIMIAILLFPILLPLLALIYFFHLGLKRIINYIRKKERKKERLKWKGRYLRYGRL